MLQPKVTISVAESAAAKRERRQAGARARLRLQELAGGFRAGGKSAGRGIRDPLAETPKIGVLAGPARELGGLYIY